MDRIAELEAEIARLRTVCEEFDVDPDWVPPKPRYWVPELWEARLTELSRDTARRLAPGIVASLSRDNALLRRLKA
jgi:hypothetical protein